jgi:hypothetical protein
MSDIHLVETELGWAFAHVFFGMQNLGLDSLFKMHAVNASCHFQHVMQNKCSGNVKILFSFHHMSHQSHMRRNGCQPATIQNAWLSLLQFKMNVGLHVRLERDFLPHHIYEHAKCIWIPIWMVDQAQLRAILKRSVARAQKVASCMSPLQEGTDWKSETTILPKKNPNVSVSAPIKKTRQTLTRTRTYLFYRRGRSQRRTALPGLPRTVHDLTVLHVMERAVFDTTSIKIYM